ncbi:MAG: FAD-linked oxidase C-terminal domain-containing protein, partial [Pseudomonadota bacterium]
ELVANTFPELGRPLSSSAPFYVLAEFASGHGGDLRSGTERWLEEAAERGLVTDGTIAADEKQSSVLWEIRHRATEAMKKDGAPCAKCDISVPIGAVPDFLTTADEAMLAMEPGARIIAFGHLGDGNIHYDILAPKDGDHEAFRHRMKHLEGRVHDIAVGFGGSFSAEHGIGQLKRDELAQRKDPVELSMMRMIKAGLDPKGLMNPGKLL